MAANGLKGFMWLDYVVFASTLAISLAVGIYHACSGGKQRTTSEYLMANRKLKPIPVALSIYMSFTSAVQILGLSAEMYVYGVQAWVSCVTDGFALMLSAYMFIPLMHPLKITSIHEYIFLRYQSWTLRRLCALGNILIQMLGMGLVIFAPATALEGVTGFPMWASVICIGVVGTIYTTLGGMKAVIWTDTIQSFIMFGGLIAIIATGLYNVGGISEVWRIAKRDGRIFMNNQVYDKVMRLKAQPAAILSYSIAVFDLSYKGRTDKFSFDPDPTLRVSFWTSSLGSGVNTFASVAAHQMAVQRYCALPTVRDARIAMLFQIPLGIFATTMVCMVGLTIYAYYSKMGCDPLRSGIISSSNQLVPYYVIDVLGYPGIPGLFIAVIFSAALSSVSSSLNTLAALTWKDIIADREVHIKSEVNRARITRLLVLMFGAVGVGLSFVMPFITGHVLQIGFSVVGSLGGAQTGIILLGTLFICAQWKGGVIGYLFGVAMGVTVMVGQNIMHPHREILPTVTDNCTLENNATLLGNPVNPEGVPWLFRLSYQYINVAGTIATLFAGLLMSFVTGARRPSKVEPKYVVDIGARCCCCLSDNGRRIDCCGRTETPVDEKQIIQSKQEAKSSMAVHPGDKEDVTIHDQVPTTQLHNRKQSHAAEHDGIEMLGHPEISTYL